MGRKCVGIVLFENIEVLDFCGPFEVFSVTRLNEERRREEPSPFEVSIQRGSPIKGPVKEKNTSPWEIIEFFSLYR